MCLRKAVLSYNHIYLVKTLKFCIDNLLRRFCISKAVTTGNTNRVLLRYKVQRGTDTTREYLSHKSPKD
jgi:hypothetical protein